MPNVDNIPDKDWNLPPLEPPAEVSSEITNMYDKYLSLYGYPMQQYGIYKRKDPLTLEEWEKWKAEMAQAHYHKDDPGGSAYWGMPDSNV